MSSLKQKSQSNLLVNKFQHLLYLLFSYCFFGFFHLILHHFGLNARLLLISNSAYSRSFCSHSLMLTEWGCDSICVGCKTGMIVELGICVFNDAIIERLYLPQFLSKDDTTNHHSETLTCHSVCKENVFYERWNHYCTRFKQMWH